MHSHPAAWADEFGHPRIEQLEVVGEFRHGAHGGARGSHRVGLVDGNGWWHAVDAVDQGLVHAIEKLPCVGGEGLDVAALPLGIHGVEDQRALARARDARDHDDLPEGEVYGKVLKIVLPSAPDLDGHGCGQ